MTRITGTLYGDRCTFMVISRSVFLRMRNVLSKSCSENQNSFHDQQFFFLKSCLLWDNVEKYVGTGHRTVDNIIHRMRLARFITWATDTHSEYVMLIAFTRQWWLQRWSRHFMIREQKCHVRQLAQRYLTDP